MQKIVFSVLVAVIGLLLLVNADKEKDDKDKDGKDKEDNCVTPLCLRCMCEGTSGCDTKMRCEGDACGPFKLKKTFWMESGRPTSKGEVKESSTAFENCANDMHCAEMTVKLYMEKFARDCNGDGVINCFDHAMIKLGKCDCKAPWPLEFKKRFDKCILRERKCDGKIIL